MSTEALQGGGTALLVILLMFAAGLKLQLTQLSALRSDTRLLLRTLAVNLLLVPMLAWIAVQWLDLPAPVGVGILLVAASPGGATATLFTDIARANLPFTVAMVMLLPAIGLISTPLTVALTADLSVPAGPLALQIAGTLLVLQLLPLALGMVVRAKLPELAGRMARPATQLANTLLVGIVLLLVWLKGHVLLNVQPATWATVVGLSAVALFSGWITGKPDLHNARSTGLIAVTRNVAVAIMLASTALSDPLTDATVLTYALLVILVPLVASMVWRRWPQAHAQG